MSSLTDTGMDFSFNRVAAMVRRYWYLLRSSWPRILDLIYWPTVQMLMWGFLQVSSQNAGFSRRPAACSSVRCCCGILPRPARLLFRFSKKCARNLGNIRTSSLRPAEPCSR